MFSLIHISILIRSFLSMELKANGMDCSSYVGLMAGKQTLNLANSPSECFGNGTIVHELLLHGKEKCIFSFIDSVNFGLGTFADQKSPSQNAPSLFYRFNMEKLFVTKINDSL